MTVWETVLARLVSLAERHDLLHDLLGSIDTKLEKIMAAIDNLQAEDADLAAEVAQVITDWQAALQNAGGANDPAIQAVADDMAAKIALLQGADPANAASAPPASDTPPADTSTPPAS